MFCNNCGKEISDQAAVCVHCGVSTRKIRSGELDGPIGGLGILCFFFPVVGLILYIIWKDEKPVKAKGAGSSALWAVGLIVGFYILFFLLMMIVGIASGGY